MQNFYIYINNVRLVAKVLLFSTTVHHLLIHYHRYFRLWLAWLQQQPVLNAVVWFYYWHYFSRAPFFSVLPKYALNTRFQYYKINTFRFELTFTSLWSLSDSDCSSSDSVTFARRERVRPRVVVFRFLGSSLKSSSEVGVSSSSSDDERRFRALRRLPGWARAENRVLFLPVSDSPESGSGLYYECKKLY